jgi:dihydrodipicolinate synthase/N-acetylneuraminate lyase
MHARRLEGVYAAPVTPFDPDGEARLDAVAANVEQLNRSALRG